MPSKFVANSAAKTGMSIEQAEKVWADAKHAVKRGKRRGSWYWGKVVTTFKRMMGLSEQLSFTEFMQIDELFEEKEDGVKKSYLDFKGSSKKKILKSEMKREIERFSKMHHKDKAAYPDDWTADKKYKDELKSKGKSLPKSDHTKEFERRFGK